MHSRKYTGQYGLEYEVSQSPSVTSHFNDFQEKVKKLEETAEAYDAYLNIAHDKTRKQQQETAEQFYGAETKLDPIKAKAGKKIVKSLAMHPEFIAMLAKVAEVSVRKGYEPFNWTQKDSPTRVSTFLEAGARHVYEAEMGFDTNVEKTLDGVAIPIYVNHLVYAAYNYLMAAYLIDHVPDHDDRKFMLGFLRDNMGEL
jgi:hypothetical protein